MPRSVQSTVILAKVETTAGTDAAPGNTTDAVLVRDFDIVLEQQFASRPLVRSFYGADDTLATIRRGRIKLVVDYHNSGTAGTAAQWGDLLIGCANAEVTGLTTPTRVEYNPTSSSRKTLTIWAYLDGLLYKFTMCMGNCVLNLSVNDVPTLEFNFTGLVSVAPAAASNPVPTLTGWIRPLAASSVNTAKVNLGGTYSAGAISGGTAFDIKSLMVDYGNVVKDIPLLTTDTIDIYNRASKAKLVLDFTAANEATYVANMLAGTTTSVSLLHGTTAGNKLLVFCPSGVISGITTERDGDTYLVGMDLVLTPTSSGNDEIKLICL